MAAKKMYKNVNQGKTSELFFFNERRRAEIRSRKCCNKNMMNTIVYMIRKYFRKESFYGMLCYSMLWYGMEIWYAMRF